jgi:hypothetical protein
VSATRPSSATVRRRAVRATRRALRYVVVRSVVCDLADSCDGINDGLSGGCQEHRSMPRGRQRLRPDRELRWGE